MRRALAFVFVFVFACVLACGGSSAPAAPPERSPLPSPSGALIADPCWPVAPMRVVEREPGGGEWKPLAEMEGDGSMVQIRTDERHFLGRVSNDAVLDAHDVPSFTCIHRKVEVPGTALAGRYDEHDEYVDARTRVKVGDDGSITLTLGTHPAEALAKVRVEGQTPRTRRTAELLVMLWLAAPHTLHFD